MVEDYYIIMANDNEILRSRKKRVNKQNKGRLFILLVFALIVLSFIIYKISKAETNPLLSMEINNRVSEETVIEIDANKLASREQISYFAETFGILPRLLRTVNRGEFIEVHLPINISAVDLNYTNFRLTSFLTSLKWKQISGTESTNQSLQVLTFQAPDSLEYRFRIYYDRTDAYPAQRPKMIIIVKGFGNLNQHELYRWVSLEYKNVCYSVLPINRNTSRMNMNHIVNNNFEALIEIPLEDPGHPMIPSPDYSIFGEFTDSQVIRTLDRYFSMLPRAKGTITHRGGLITTDRRIMPLILNYIKERNMYFIDDRAIDTSIAYNLAQQIMLTSYERTVSFNPQNYLNDTNNYRLANDLRQFTRNPVIITLQRPDDVTYDFLLKLIRVASESGYEIVRVSEL